MRRLVRPLAWSALGFAAALLGARWALGDAWTGVGAGADAQGKGIELRPLPLALAALLALLNPLLGGARLAALTRRAGPRAHGWGAEWRRALRAYLIGLLADALTPGGSGGAPAAAWALVRGGAPPHAAGAAVLRAATLDLLFFAWAVPAALLVLGDAAGSPALRAAAWISGGLFGAAWWVLAFRTRLLRRAAAALLRPWPRRRRRVLRLAGRIEEAARGAAAGPWRRRLAPHLWTIPLHGSTYATFAAALAGFGGDAPALLATALALLASVAAFAVPTPGGGGAPEAIAAASAASLGEGAATTAAAVVAWRLLVFWLRLPLGAAAAAGLDRGDPDGPGGPGVRGSLRSAAPRRHPTPRRSG